MRSRIRNAMYEKWINKKVLSLLDQIRFNKDPNDKNPLDTGENIIPSIKNS